MYKDKLQIYFDKLYTKGDAEFGKEVYNAADKNEKKFIITANPETLMIAQKNEVFGEILEAEDSIIVPDGIGVVKAAKLLGKPVAGRVTGVELSKKLFEYADKTKKSVCLFGAKEEVLQLLIEKIHKEYPGVIIAGYANGYEENKAYIMRELLKKEPDIFLVALGIPQQEMLIAKFYRGVSKGIFVGVGGTFDVLSGMKKRAPKIFIKLNLKRLYRIMREPQRIKRFVKNNIIFIWRVLKIKGGKTK